MPSDEKYEVLALFKLEEKFDAIVEGVAKALLMPYLPSPSQMRVDDLPRILHGDLPKEIVIYPSSMEESTSKPEMETVRNKIEQLVKNNTEMEATIRVLT